MTFRADAPRRRAARWWGALLAATLLAAAAPATAAAQVPIPQLPGRQTDDTVKVDPFRVDPPVSPLGAMARSLLLPGWGQAVLDRRVTGAIFVFWEGITLTMTVKAKHQLGYMERIDSESVEAKRQEVEDWFVLLVFNHLFAAAEAFVAANLWDFPADVRFQPLPNGAYGLGARVPIP